MGIFKKSNVKIIKNSILIGLKNQRIARKVKILNVTGINNRSNNQTIVRKIM